MRRLEVASSFALAAMLGLACGDGGDGPPVDGVDAAPGTPDAAAPGTPDAATPTGDWEELIAGDWSMPAGTEGYRCVRITATEDIWIGGYDYLIPNGTHHTVLSVGDPDRPDGITTCNAAENHDGAIGGSGVGTQSTLLPPGVGMKVAAGQQMLLNLHLFNATDADLNGRSGILIKRLDPTEVEHEAELILMGKIATLYVPNGDSTSMGTCVMNGDVTLIMVTPHMHQLGVHMRVVAESSVVGEVDILDEDYSFWEQRSYPLEEHIPMRQGDRLRVYCSYSNPGAPVGFGDSSTEEMCFASTVRYPKLGGDFGTIFCATD